MPKWDYTCEKCDHQFEVTYNTLLDRDKEEAKVGCPECGCTEKIRLFPVSGSFSLKGKWFKDGY